MQIKKYIYIVTTTYYKFFLSIWYGFFILYTFFNIINIIIAVFEYLKKNYCDRVLKKIINYLISVFQVH